MLNGVPANIGPELLKVLSEMGHGDELVIADGNFPAASLARRLVRADGLGVPELLESVLKLIPLDTYVESPLALMAVVEGDAEPEIWEAYETIIGGTQTTRCKVTHMDRQDFYERASQAYAVVATSERAVYANIIIKKGVVRPEETQGM
jgi:fucose operon fucU protein